MRQKYSPSPVFLRLAEYYIHPDIYNNWTKTPLQFKVMVKNYLIDYINAMLKPHVKNLPFLKIDFMIDKKNWLRQELVFEENIKAFLNERKVVKVFLWNKKGFRGDIVPLSSEEIRKFKDFTEFAGGGFEIGLGAYMSKPKILTTFAHEVAHTYFFDIYQDPPKCLISNEILKKSIWYQEFEGMAYDLGRELLLPRENFRSYVTSKGGDPSLENFLKMRSELGVSKEVLAQRLIKDLKLWNVCIFWGKVSTKKEGSFKNFEIFVKDRDKRIADSLRNFINLKKELKDQHSELTATIIKHVTETSNEKSKKHPYQISIPIGKTRKLDCLLEVRRSLSHRDEIWFIALLRLAETIIVKQPQPEQQLLLRWL